MAIFGEGDLIEKTLKPLQEKLNRRNELQGRREESRGQFENVIQNILQRGQQLSDQPTLTAQDLFGEEIQNLQDNARANANATKSALSRSLLAGGGDASGTGAVNLLRADQQTNQQLGQITDRFNTLATKIGESRQQRGDSMISRALSGGQSLFSADTNILSDFITREAQKETARKQRRSNMFGGILSTLGTLGGAAIMACWVAEELYPEDQQKVKKVREFLSEASEKDVDIAEFTTAYQLHGDEWAEKIKTNPEARKAAKRLFDEFYELSKAA